MGMAAPPAHVPGCVAVLLALALCTSRVAGQQASPLQGQGTVPDGITDVYFSAYLERLLKVDDVEYQVSHWLRASQHVWQTRFTTRTFIVWGCINGRAS